MLKKTLTLMLAFLIVLCPLSLSACKDKNDDDGKNNPGTTGNPLVSITLSENLKDTFFLNEELNLDGIDVVLTYKDDSTKNIDLSLDMISGFDTSTTGEKTLTVTYKKKTYTHDYTVVEAVATSIEVDTPFKSNYFTNHPVDVAEGKLLVTYSDNSTKRVFITADMISNFDSTSAGTKTLTITYLGCTTTFEYVVTDPRATKITIASAFKTNYFVGDTIDISGGKITVTYEDNSTSTLPVSALMISGFNTESSGSKIMSITVGDATLEIAYQVNKVEITSISISKPFKTSYIQNETLDTTGGKLDVVYNNGKTQTIDITTSMISNFNSTSPSVNEKTMTLSYEGFTLQVKYTVSEITITSYGISTPFKNEYFVGDKIDVSGGFLNINYSDGSFETVQVTTDMISEFYTDTDGEFEMFINYKNISIKFEYTVTAVTIETIELSSPLTKTTYYVGESIDLSGGILTLTYNNGKTETVSTTANGVTYTGFSTNLDGENKTLTIKYKRKTVTTKYTVIDASIAVTTEFKTSYVIGEELDVSGGQITVTYGDGKTPDVINITKDMITGFDSSSVGAGSLTITYQGKTTFVAYIVSELPSADIN